MPSFQYRHMGSFAYIGGDKAVLDPAYKNGNVGPLKGWLMGFAWKVGVDSAALSLTQAKQLPALLQTGTTIRCPQAAVMSALAGLHDYMAWCKPWSVALYAGCGGVHANQCAQSAHGGKGPHSHQGFWPRHFRPSIMLWVFLCLWLTVNTSGNCIATHLTIPLNLVLSASMCACKISYCRTTGAVVDQTGLWHCLVSACPQCWTPPSDKTHLAMRLQQNKLGCQSSP